MEDGRGRLCHGGLPAVHGEQAKLVLHNIRNSLRVRCRARSATPDGVVYSRQLIGDSVCDVSPGRGSRIGAYLPRESDLEIVSPPRCLCFLFRFETRAQQGDVGGWRVTSSKSLCQ